MSANKFAKTSEQTFPVPSGWTDVTLKFLGLKCSCRVKHYIYGVAQHHNEWDILSIMAHTLLPNYNTTNIQVHCHISQCRRDRTSSHHCCKSLCNK